MAEPRRSGWRRCKQTGSILDSVMQEVSRLQGTLGPGDRTKLTEYLDSVREIEQRIQSTEKKGASEPLELPDRPVDVPETFEEHAKLMYDLMVLGYRADVTRVFTMIMARELSRYFTMEICPETTAPCRAVAPDQRTSPSAFGGILLMFSG